MRRPDAKLSPPPLARFALALFALVLSPATSRAGLTFSTSRADFNAQAQGLPVGSFAGANLYSQPYVTEANGLNAATNDAVYSAGSILPGITVSTLNPGMQSTALLVYSAGVNGFNVGTNWFQDTLVLGFAPGVSAVGEDVFGNTNPGPNIAGSVAEVVYSGTTRIGSTSLTESAGSIGFIGVTSTIANITSIQLLFNPSVDVDSNTFVRDVAFGTPTTVPEPSSLALSALGVACLLGLRSARVGTALGAHRPG